MRQHEPAHTATVSFILSVVNKSAQELRALHINPHELLAIYQDYIQRQDELTDTAIYISRILEGASHVHSIKFRVKEPQHLLKKIIRKKREYPNRHFNRHTYLHLINDLIGVRVLHLYKEHWAKTGHYITRHWQLKRPPYAYVVSGESNPEPHTFGRFGCQVMAHPSGYKAVHFVIQTQPGRQRYFAEIQLRTLFEEGWSEIDHSLRYPDHNNNELINLLLQILNRFTSQSDAMASFTRHLTLAMHSCKHPAALDALYAQLANLPLTQAEKQQLYTLISSARRQ